MQYLGSRVPLNIPHFRDFAATVKSYTHPNNVLGIFFCHNNNSDLCHFLGQAKWHVTGLGSQTNMWGAKTGATTGATSDMNKKVWKWSRGLTRSRTSSRWYVLEMIK